MEEFFELFKTPWEFFVPDHKYDAVIVTSEHVPIDVSCTVLLIYGSRGSKSDTGLGVASEPRERLQPMVWDSVEIPLYGQACSLQGGQEAFLWGKGSTEVLGFARCGTGRPTVRIGYDLFQEVALLLTKGQPNGNAHIPTVELHIALLRGVLLANGAAFVEIPPVPAGYEYMTCLTHDVDFTGVREHKLDHTMWGFVYRGLAASLFDATRGRTTWSKCWKNWKAVLSLPFVYLGWKDDFWLEFDRYMEIEKGLGSTFFFIPFKNDAGTRGSDPAPKRRAAKYDLAEIRGCLRELVEQRCEIGLHGIDAWQAPTKAQAEVSRIGEVAGQPPVGVRMHWLYFSEESPKMLEEAGLSYDSTFGYNDGVGFRAGTSQAFRPIGVKELLELPLGVQDTALFYPGRMHLSEGEAMVVCKNLMKSMELFGGVLVVNWHTRSLSPERLWGEFYTELLNQIRQHRVWFATAQQIVSWFRTRRAARFDGVEFAEDVVSVRMSGLPIEAHPPLLLRVHYPNASLGGPVSTAASTHFRLDTALSGETELKLMPPGFGAAENRSRHLSSESSVTSLI